MSAARFQLVAFLCIFCAYDASSAFTSPMRGWMTWERFTCEEDCDRFPETCISEHLVLTTIDAMVSEGFVEHGYNYVQIDDCWLSPRRTASGDLQADPKRFPRGIKFLAGYAHAKGMKLGLYSDIGSSTCCGVPSLNVSAVPNAGADAQLQRDVELMTSWGMDSLKVDGCNADAKTMNITYPKLGEALKDAAKKFGLPAVPWYSCSWPGYVADILCNHERTEPCVPLQQIAVACNSGRMYTDIADTWQSADQQRGVKNIIDFWMQNPQLAALRNGLPAGSMYYNDPDQLMVGNNGLSRTVAEVQMGMWVMFAAPLIMSTELRNGSLSADMKKILLNREVLSVADDTLGLQATQCIAGCSHNAVLYSGMTSVWNKTLIDGSVAVALLNTGNFGNRGSAFGDFNITFTAEAIGLHCGLVPFKVRDLFKHVDVGTFVGTFWNEVDESSMMLLRVHCAGSTLVV